MAEAYVVPPGARRTRADKALAAAFPEHSRSAIQRAFARGLVRRGERILTQSDTVLAGDRIEFSLPEIEAAALAPAEIPLRVLFEDEHLIALDKPPGMVVHPGAGTGGDTLVHALLAHCRGTLSGIGGVERPGIVHRLDKETSGVVIAAKSDAAHRGLAEQFAARTVVKEYLALVAGAPGLAAGQILRPIGRHPRRRYLMAILPQSAGGRPAHTDWALVERLGSSAALVRCVLHTGRTHQVRVHLRSLGHPLLGDARYGWRAAAGMPRPPRVMLHAEHLALTHPVTGRRLELRAPLPEDFRAMIEALRAPYCSSASTAKPQRRL